MSVFPHGFPGVTIWPIRSGVTPTIVMAATPPRDAPAAGAEDAEWDRLTALNPRLFDGPILSLVSFDPATGRVSCRRETYKRLSVQGAVDTGVVLVAVNAVLIARDARGEEHVLLGRRSPQVRKYGGMWELAPAGGLDPPAGVAATLGPGALRAQLRRELLEEVGLDDALEGATPIAFYRDEAATSFNIVLRVELPTTPAALAAAAGERHWDCDAVMWLARADAPAFDRDRAGHVIDATRALLRFIGWVP